MASNNAPWADAPFALIPTPGDGQDLNRLHEAVFLAREMACAHNGMLRSLNSIYQQCVHVSESQDILDLLQYSKFWCAWLEEHHEAEEKWYFPDIERITGVEDLMAGMVTQHKDFMPGLEELTKYVNETTVEAYDGRELRRIVDDFGAILTKHLTEEVEVLAALEVHDGPALKHAYLEFDKELRKGDKSVLFPMVLGSTDRTYEKGPMWPPVPDFLKYVVHYWFERKYQGAWRFSPSTTWGEKRPLLCLGES
ncbi:uncharacterized protein LY89DRAFT_680770 [Mollisia scopiformis]|uniref:Hemerythrin-like domain-containing protein n=1 Tax=Mollisia scopiformis TaxID=149040 RepID=A0A194XR38_MOLSC|nr:uncharacterized protein LY89DRAFT_680770 [Mollisia scopiformis]KUJ22653.1 hypothetical protein LY89DRAFT_680770 [Mollisia scopiformis]